MFCLSQRRARTALALAVVVAVGFPFAYRESSAAPAPSDARDLQGLCKLESLPEDIRGTLTRRFGEWKVQEPTDLSGPARDKWTAESSVACPGIASGRFQNEKDDAYALLLIPTDRSDPEYALVIFTQQPNAKGIFGYKLVDRVETGGSDTYIVSTPTLKFLKGAAVWKSRSPPRDSLLLVNVGAKGLQAYVYYWATDGFQKQQVDY